ncbi:unnamed protein product [Mesocestoides corti]|uniref:Uncharacterized protein n=1 Tax=Mesocestoides corti TaxID=53468 RepID=A0A0R3U549_MESCO|nr:unnamed protein product [Mesocestoides corti]
MESDSKIDMSLGFRLRVYTHLVSCQSYPCPISTLIFPYLDEIIKLNRKNQKLGAGKPRARVRGLGVKRTAGLRASLARPMKSRQSSAALAIFQKARRTAAIAAKVAADAAALVAPSGVLSRNNRRIGGMSPPIFFNNRNLCQKLAVVGAEQFACLPSMSATLRCVERFSVFWLPNCCFSSFDVARLCRQYELTTPIDNSGGRNQPPRMRNLAVRQRILAVNQQIYQRQRRRQEAISRRQQQAQQIRFTNTRQSTRTNNTNGNFQQQQFTRTQTARSRTWRGNQFNNRQLGRQVQVRGRNAVGLTVQTSNNIQSQRYQQYLAQARALIRAQQERRNDNSLYVDAPVRNRGFSRNAGRGRFRR